MAGPLTAMARTKATGKSRRAHAPSAAAKIRAMRTNSCLLVLATDCICLRVFVGF
jgi:hypothetical protein